VGCGDRQPSVPLFGLAPHGVYHAPPVSRGAVRSYRTLSPLPPADPGAVYSLRHFPSRCRGRALPGMPPVVESGPSSETEASANARLLQPRQGYHLVNRCAPLSASKCPIANPFVPVPIPVPVPGTLKRRAPSRLQALAYPDSKKKQFDARRERVRERERGLPRPADAGDRVTGEGARNESTVEAESSLSHFDERGVAVNRPKAPARFAQEPRPEKM
jgi:hypothetical protein